jgi:flagellar hook-length control protein FliK
MDVPVSAPPAAEAPQPVSAPRAENAVASRQNAKADGGKNEFKKMLGEFRQAKGNASRGENKNAPAITSNGAISEAETKRMFEAALALSSAEDENAAAEEAAAKKNQTRFDPDIILNGLENAAVEVEEESAGENETDVETDAEETDASGDGAEKITTEPASATVAEDETPAAPPADQTPEPDGGQADGPGLTETITAETVPAPRQKLSKNTKTSPADEKKPAETPEAAPEKSETGGEEIPETETEKTAGTGEMTSGAQEETRRGGKEQDDAGESKTDARNEAGEAAKSSARRTGETNAKDTSRASARAETPAPVAARDAAVMPGATDTRVTFAERAARSETPAALNLPMTYVLKGGDAFGEGLTSVVEFMRSDGTASARIIVEPPALGRVDISLTSTSSGVEANFRVDNEELRQMVQKNLDSLKESLEAQGIHLSAMTVDIRNNEGRDGRGDAYGNKKTGKRGAVRGGEKEDAEAEKVLRLDLEQGLLHWVA